LSPRPRARCRVRIGALYLPQQEDRRTLCAPSGACYAPHDLNSCVGPAHLMCILTRTCETRAPNLTSYTSITWPPNGQAPRHTAAPITAPRSSPAWPARARPAAPTAPRTAPRPAGPQGHRRPTTPPAPVSGPYNAPDASRDAPGPGPGPGSISATGAALPYPVSPLAGLVLQRHFRFLAVQHL